MLTQFVLIALGSNLLDISHFAHGLKSFQFLEEHEGCTQWAREDNQCAENPRFMWGHCFSACVDHAVDDNVECERWAMEGECTANPNYIHQHCPDACGYAIAWSPWVRRSLYIDEIGVNKDVVAHHDLCDKAPHDLRSAAEIVRGRLHDYLGGGHNSVDAFSSFAPSEYLGMLGLAEAVLYSLRLYKTFFESILSVTTMEHQRPQLYKNNIEDVTEYIEHVNNVIESGYSPDLLLKELPHFLSFLDAASVAATSATTSSGHALQTDLEVYADKSCYEEEETRKLLYSFSSSSGTGTASGIPLHRIVDSFPEVIRQAGEEGEGGRGNMGDFESTINAQDGSTAEGVFSRQQPRGVSNLIVNHNSIDAAITLRNGVTMPMIGLGTWLLEGNECRETVYKAVKEGYRSIDTAEAYRNDVQVGMGLEQAITEGLVRREELFVASKISDEANGGFENTMDLINHQLSNMYLDYFDLYMLHSPQTPQVQAETWRAMETLYNEGKIRALGVSNFNTQELSALLSVSKVKPMVLQNKLDVYHIGKQLDNQGEAILEFAQSKGVVMVSYSSFSAYPFVMKPTHDPIVAHIAASLTVTPAQVLLKWAMQRGIASIPRSSNVENLRSNIQAAAMPPLSATHMNMLDTLQHLVGSGVSRPVDLN